MSRRYYDDTIYDRELLNVYNDDRNYRKFVRKFLKSKTRIIKYKIA